jgi:PAS domain S-box-containing protein
MDLAPPRAPVENTELVLEEVFRHTPVGMVLSDLHGRILDVNDSMCAIVGSNRAELLGRTLYDLCHPDDAATFRARAGVLREGGTRACVVSPRFVARDGRVVHVKLSVSVVDSRSHQPVRHVAFVENITERHAAQQLVIESEERYRRLVNNLPVAVWENDWSVVAEELKRRGLTSPQAMVSAIANDPSLYETLGTTVRVTTVNPAALAIAGVENVREFDAWLAGAATPETALRFSELVPALLFGDRVSAMDEYTLIRANGEQIDVMIRIARSPRWEEERTISTIAVDVTQRKRIERELVHKQELTDRAEAAAHFGSWEWNSPHDVVFGSPEFWRILDGGEGSGPARRPVQECLARLVPEDAVEANLWWDTLRAPSSQERQREFTREYRLLRPDGSIAIVRGQNFATYANNGSMIRAFGILHDITKAKQAEEEAARQRLELIRADKMITLGILVSGMAHEVNNPNHTIGLNVPLLRDVWREVSVLLDELAGVRDVRIGRMSWAVARGEVAAMIDDIGLSSERVRNIVSELRAFALDHSPGERKAVAINDVVRSSMRLLGKHIERATKHFTLSLADDLPLVSANASRIEQIVTNLVLNACQALESDEQGINVTTGFEGGRVFIRVQDEGCGMSADNLANIRTPFFTTKRATGGTGLGVPVADRITQEHGGQLTFESEPGRGTSATLWLPVPRT